MNCFWTLTGYEYKKLLKRKIIWITLVIMIGFSVFSVCSKMMGLVVSDGDQTYTSWDILQRDRDASMSFEGNKLDEQTLSELHEIQLDETKWVPGNLYDFVSKIRDKASGENEVQIDNRNMYQLSEDELYQMRNEALENYWEEQRLTDTETRVLQQEEKRLTVPFTLNYAKCFQQLITIIYAIGIMQSLLIAVCVPQIFTEEHQRKMSPLIMSSRFGKNELFWAKLFVGITFSVLGTILLYGFMAVTACVIYGGNGFGTQIQIYFPMFSWNLTMGQMLCILMGLGIVSAVVQSALAMTLAEKYKNSTAPMAILMGIMLVACFINIPQQFRPLSQWWGFLPMNLLSRDYVFSGMMIPLFGKQFPTWQTAPVIYLLISLVSALAGMRLYKNYQVGEK